MNLNPVACVEIEKKLATEELSDPKALSNFGIEYSTSGDDSCNVCKGKIVLTEIRIKRIIYDSYIARQFGKEITWNHLQCFASRRSTMGYKYCGSLLPGYVKLNPQHQEEILDCLP